MLRPLLIAMLLLTPALGLAQGMKVAFGQHEQDTNLPVEVTADSLSVNQNDGSAVFTGNVNISQGQMRMSADTVNVQYNEDRSGISRLLANGDVLVAQGDDVAEAENADYDIDNGTVTLSGNVMVVQELSTITADQMLLNLRENTAQMHGSVKTILRTE